MANGDNYYNYIEYPNLANGLYQNTSFYRVRHFPKPIGSERDDLGQVQFTTSTKPANNNQVASDYYSRRDLFYGCSKSSSPNTRLTQNPTDGDIGNTYRMGSYIEAYDWEYHVVSDGPWVRVYPTKQGTSTAYVPFGEEDNVTWEYRWFAADGQTVIEPAPNSQTTETEAHTPLQQFYVLNESNDSSGYSYTHAESTPDISDILAKLSKELEKPERNIPLSQNFVLKDLINTDDFIVPQSPTVTVKTYSGTYNNGDEPTWGSEETTNTMGNPAWNGSENGIVGNVSFYDKYISATHTSGEKIVITIEGLTLTEAAKKRTGRVYSNDVASGIYRNAEGNTQELVTSFPRPYVELTSDMSPAGETGDFDPATGVVVNKSISPNSNGNYDLTLEAYSTKKNEQIKEKIPTDFVVVVDQSGSMDTTDMPAGYKKASGTKTIEDVVTGKYYIKSDDGNYYRVYGTRDYLYRYYPANYWFTGDLIEHFGTKIRWFMPTSDAVKTINNAFYFLEVVNGEKQYLPITTTIEGKVGTYYMRFSYNSKLQGKTYDFNRELTQYSPNGKSPWYKNVVNGTVMSSGALWEAANWAVQGIYPQDYAYTFSELDLGLVHPRTGMYINYPMYERFLSYNKLCYRDINGVEHVLSATNGQSSWEYCNDEGQAVSAQDANSARPVFKDLYEADGTISRLDALKTALRQFATAVSLEKDDFGPVDNSIAVVGFSSPGYNNTELLTGENLVVRNNNGIQKNNASTNDYSTALVSATNGNIGTTNPKITDAINALTANGGTQPEDGLNMAEQILKNRSKSQYIIRSGARKDQPTDRKTVVIFFTDGQPGDYHESNQYDEANDVVEQAKLIKDYNDTSLFSIGVFGESDGNPLTYADETQKQDEHDEWLYLGGWMETYKVGSTYYCLRRQWRPNNEEYTQIANDTIYDYMSVTSSNYPDAEDYIAPEWLSGEFSGNYKAATDGVRNKDTAATVNNYYRMAANQETLISAFTQAVTMTNNTIADQVQPDASAILQDVLKENTFVRSNNTSIYTSTYVGTMDNNGVVTFESSPEANGKTYPASLTTITDSETGNEITTGIATGFDYMENYIAYGKDAADGLQANQGRKLVVTITDVYPAEGAVSEGAANVFSNNPGSALFGKYEGTATAIKEFRSPSITRHSYTLDVGDVNKNATFDVSATIVDSTGNEVSKDAADLEDVIIAFPRSNMRALYSSVGAQTFEDMKNLDSFYFENVPDDYRIQVSLKASDEAYRYYLLDEDDDGQQIRIPIPTNTSVSSIYDYDNITFHVVSEPSKKDVTIREQTVGSYANLNQVFDEIITMDIPAGEQSSGTITKEFACTLSEGYHGFNDETLPANADSYKAVFEGSKEGDTYVTTLKEIISITGSVEKHYPIQDGKLPLKNGEGITLSVDTGNTVKVLEDDTHEHNVTYYYTQDDVKASNIKLSGLSGEEEAYTLTFHPLESETSASDMTVTFDGDGNITKVGNVNVNADTVLNLAPYGSVSSEDGLESAQLSVDGTHFYFMSEGSEENQKYVAYIKQFPQEPPCSVTVDKNNMDILILNERHDIPVEGISDSESHNWIIYILAALGGLAVIGAGIFLWKKRNEFVEE